MYTNKNNTTGYDAYKLCFNFFKQSKNSFLSSNLYVEFAPKSTVIIDYRRI